MRLSDELKNLSIFNRRIFCIVSSVFVGVMIGIVFQFFGGSENFAPIIVGGMSAIVWVWFFASGMMKIKK